MFSCSECGETSGGEERRDRLLREMVSHKIAASDAASDLLELIREQPANPLAKALLAVHARLVRLLAEDDDDVHNIINGLDRLSHETQRVPA